MFKEFIHYQPLSGFQKKEINKFKKDLSYKYENIDCPLCSNKNHKILFDNERHGIKQKTVMCLNCGLVFLNPRMDYESTKQFYNSDIYRLIYSKDSDKDKSNFYTSVCKEIEDYKFTPPKLPNFTKYYANLYLDFIYQERQDFKNICDIGCGKGLKLLDFKNLDKKVFGVDPSKILNKCHKKYHINSKVGFIDDIEGSYDLVLITHVLEHLHNIDEAIKKIEKITKKYLFIEVPGHVKKLQSIQNAHNFYFSFNTLNHFVQNNKFRLIKMDYARDSEFIFALFEKTEKKNNFTFSYDVEKKFIDKIMIKYQFKYVVLKILKFFYIEKIVKKIFNMARKN